MTNKMKLFVGSVFALVALVATSANAAYSHTMTLKMGQSNSQVMELQKALNGGGFLVASTGAGSPGMESMYFGAKTKAAVVAFQKAKGLGADGIVGLNTGTALAAMTSGSVSYPAGCSSTSGYSSTTGVRCDSVANSTLPAGCTSTSGYSTTTGASCSGAAAPSGALSGNVGSINSVDTLSTYSNEKVGEGDVNTKVFGFEVEADSGSDLNLQSFKIVLENTASGSGKLSRYADSVSVWMGSTKVGSADVDDFSEDSDVYTASIKLSGAVVKADEKAKFYVAVSAVDNIDSTDLSGNTWKIDIDSIRYNDASGAILTETTTNTKNFTFASLASAADLELKVNLSSSNLKAQTVKVSTTSDTDQVELLKFTMKAQGGKMHIDAIPVLLTATGTAAADLDQLVGNLTLKLSTGDTFDETVSSTTSTSVVTFDDLDFDIAEGDTVTGTIYADVNDIDTGFAEGDTLMASLRSTDVLGIDVEDTNGDQLVAGDRSGSATGEAMTFRSTGVNVVMGTPTLVTTPGAQGVYDQARYTIPVSVTSFGNTLYVGQSVQLVGTNSTISGTNAFGFAFQKSSAPTTDVVTGVTYTATLSSDATIESSGFRLDDGSTKHFTITVNIYGGNTAAEYRVALDHIQTFTNAGLSTGSSVAALLPAEQFRTGYQLITK